jgi:hypothetical protein
MACWFLHLTASSLRTGARDDRAAGELMSTIAWTYITALGDFDVLLPCIAIMGSWLLWSTSTRLLAWRWLSVLTLVGTAVVMSKLVFTAWGIGIPSLDFTGFSGHSAMAATVWPAAFTACRSMGSKLALMGSGYRLCPGPGHCYLAGCLACALRV